MKDAWTIGQLKDPPISESAEHSVLLYGISILAREGLVRRLVEGALQRKVEGLGHSVGDVLSGRAVMRE